MYRRRRTVERHLANDRELNSQSEAKDQELSASDHEIINSESEDEVEGHDQEEQVHVEDDEEERCDEWDTLPRVDKWARFQSIADRSSHCQTLMCMALTNYFL